MPRTDARQRRWPLVTGIAIGLVLVLVAGAALAAWQLGYVDDWLGDGDRPTDPATIAPPPEVDIPEVDPRPDPVAQPADVDGPLDRAAVLAALRPWLRERGLGRHVLTAVAPLEGAGAIVSGTGPGVATPASTTKVVTSTAALYLLGADHTFETTTVLERGGGAGVPRLVLVGGGDPFLLSSRRAQWGTSTPATFEPPKADIGTLAAQTAAALVDDGVRAVRLGFDDSLFSGPAVNPHWESDYVPDGVVSPISALWVDEGRDPSGYGRVADPALAAAQVFRDALVAAGVRVTGAPERTVADGSATDVASVSSPTLAAIVQRLLEVSDNEATEVLLRHVGLADQGEGSFVGGQRGVQRVLAAEDVSMRGSVLYDGSGLSRENLMSPQLLVDVLRLAASDEQPDLRAVLTGLPVAAYTGSLTERMDLGPPAGRGRVRAKTGTLTGVRSLAGIAVDADGNLMVFALMADRIIGAREGLASDALDNAALALGACRCGR